MQRNFKLLIYFLLLIFAACSKNTDLSHNSNNKNDSTLIAPLGLYSVGKTGNPFDQFRIKLNNMSGTLRDYVDSYDSIISFSSNGDTTMAVLNQSADNIKLVNEWSVVFYTQGDYTLYLKGYKNGKTIKEDSMHFTIKIDPSFDFLNYKWSDPQTDPSIGFINPYFKNNFGLLKRNGNGVNYINVYGFSFENSQPVPIAQQSKDLYNLIFVNYGQPDFSDSTDNQKLQTNYHSIFKSIDNNDTPSAIWITQKSNVVLLKDSEKYYIHAEEKK